jgi:hypothetical protein
MKYLVMSRVEMYGTDQIGCEGVFDTRDLAQSYIDDMCKEFDADAWIEEVNYNPKYE